jgi:hypothetical protein
MKAWGIFRVLPLALVVFVGACSSRYSTLEDRSGKPAMLYTLSEDEALKLAHATIVSTFPGRAITTLNGPTKGYSTSTRFVLDTYSQQVLVLPATGKTAAGETISGYYFEVSGSGSSGSGRARNQQFAENIRANLAKSGTGVTVSDVQMMLPATSPIPDGPSQPPITNNGPSDPLTQIERLKTLLDKGAITPQEYEAKKTELMKRL